MSSATRNVRDPEFHELFRKLPRHVQSLARRAFRMFLRNPRHPALRLHQLNDNAKGRHRAGSFSVSITMKYRVLFVVRDGTNVWYWIGSHNDYENFIGKK